ncbi:transcriptional coactivator p15 family protein [Diaporthe amygdali]|uniref:transcriptional coactivator p15 family protein n=1 Tax=Phomopsis amygdali TaxID=1214568 RepID=UPI0022FF3D9F|nr:transcriptional coactivator p15 family protein [Diaporthe amygdali]KAJ0119967.1 transcriptional coactivator p15 family protein [Diaporthe amygdali]
MGKRSSSFVVSDNSSGDERPAKASKKVKKEVKKGSSSKNGTNVDDEGNAFWELSGKRRIVVQEFKGNWFVNLREYYEDKSGEMRPGKKGIMLSVEQYQTLVGNVPAITKELRKHGVKIAGGDAAEDDAEVDAEEELDEKPVKSKKKDSKAKKANIEATSDEDEDSD